MSRKLTFKQLRTEKGWPFCRQYTHQLSKDGKFLKPIKAVEGGKLNLWDEEEYDTHIAKRTTNQAA